jgi:hypothetical protein
MLFQAKHDHMAKSNLKDVGAASSCDHPIASRLKAAPTKKDPVPVSSLDARDQDL